MTEDLQQDFMRLLPRPPRRLIPVLLLTCGFLLASVFFVRLAFVQQAGNSIRAELYGLGAWSHAVFASIFSDKEALQQENEMLRTRLADLTIDQAEFSRLKQQYADLTALLGYLERPSYKMITARVLSRSAQRSGELILVDQGSSDGLEIDQAVVAGDGVLVGQVSEVHEATSVVRLVTDRASRVGARLLGTAEGTIGIAEGSDGTIIHISYIPQDVNFDRNDVVVSSGLDASIPAGLVIGMVTDVVADEHDPFQSATVEPILDLRELSMVAILSLTP